MWQRAQELKKELLRPTTKLPDNRASNYERMILGATRYAGPSRRRSFFLPFCFALMLGALSMTIPVAGTFTLQGTLSANVEPAAAEGALALEGAAGRALVFGSLAECPWLQLDEPAIVTLDVPGQSDLVISASPLSIEAHASATDTKPQCRIELALLPEGEEAAVLRGLPLGAAIRADFPTTRNWIGAFVAQLPTDSRQALDRASAGLRTASSWVRQMYRTHVAPRLHKAGWSGKSEP